MSSELLDQVSALLDQAVDRLSDQRLEGIRLDRLAVMWDCSVQTLRRATKSGELDASLIGESYVVSRQEAARFFRERSSKRRAKG